MAASPSETASIVVEAPVQRVVIMEDRAQVERRGEVAIPAGPCRIEVHGISLAAVDRSLQCEVHGARLLEATLVRTWREKPAGGLGADASELRRREHGLSREAIERADEVARVAAGTEVLASAWGDLLRGIAETAGWGPADPSAWADQVASLTQRQAEADEALRVARRESAHVGKQLDEVRAALAASEQVQQDLTCSLVITVESEGPTRVGARASYLVPCAVWRPAYRATLQRPPGHAPSVRLETEAVVWQHTGERWDAVEVALSTSRPTLGTSPPSLVADELTTRPKLEAEKHVVPVALREQAIPRAGEAFLDDIEMPGLDDGGEVRLLRPAGGFTIPSDGQPHRVPIFAFEAPAELERVCPAEFTPLVSLVARFPNAGGDVLLAGPVVLVRDSGFVGRAQLAFAAPGETVKLSFGSDDGLRVIRSAEEKKEESRITSRRTIRHTVRHFVSNAGADAVRLVIEERVPVSEVKEVEVEVLARECQPEPAPPSKDGIARIELDLLPHGRRETTFVWELSAGGRVAGV
jgi:uncharacterized protein (TIGR02231 family)